MRNIYLKVTIENNFRIRTLSLKDLSPGQFLGSWNSPRYHWILNLLQLKSESKIVSVFPIILILKGIMTF